MPRTFMKAHERARIFVKVHGTVMVLLWGCKGNPYCVLCAHGLTLQEKKQLLLHETRLRYNTTYACALSLIHI